MRATTLRPTDGFPADQATGVIAVTSPSVPETTPAAPLIKAPGLVTPIRFHRSGALWRVFRIGETPIRLEASETRPGAVSGRNWAS